jgi:hypothetical protein
MKYDEELIKIVKNKKFKSFWHCLDFLIMAGYPTMDAFGISLQEFGESKVYSDVAFIRIEESRKLIGDRFSYSEKARNIKIGIIDDTNIHLAGLYSTYRTWISERKQIGYSDIEATCETFEIPELNQFLMDYLKKVSKLHYGFEAFHYEIKDNVVALRNDRHEYIAGIDPATGIYSMQPEINALMRSQQRLEDLERGLNRNND